MQDIAPVLIVFGFLGTIFGLAYLFFSTRHRERIALIEKGADASIFFGHSRHKYGPSVMSRITLKLGMLAAGIGLGVGIAVVLSSMFRTPDGYSTMNEGVYPAIIFMIGGLSLVLNFFVERRIDEAARLQAEKEN